MIVRDRLRQALPAAIGLGLFLAALEVLRHELSVSSWAAVRASLAATPGSRIAAAIGLTVLNYLVLTGYDFLAFASIGRRLSAWRIAMASLLAYAIANNVGFAMLSGASVRYRFYTRWGVGAEELSRIIVSYSITFWLGLFALGGVSLALGPIPRADAIPGAVLAAPFGWLLFSASLGFIVLTAVRKTPLRVWRLEVALPSPTLAAAQWLTSCADWIIAALVLVVLLPPGVPLFAAIGAFLAAQLIGLVSHVPGGAGVFEGLIVLLLKPYAGSAELVAPLVMYRSVYYLLPLGIALIGLLLDAGIERRAHARRAAITVTRIVEQLTPRILSALTFLTGVLLLFSGATPAAEGRLQWLNQFIPLGVVETSHFAGSLAGAVLLILSQGLARRLDAAYHLTTSAIVVGIGASLLKGADVEEAIVLSVLLVLLRLARPAFDRRASIFETRFSTSWIAAVTAAIAASLWLGLFAFKHVDYSHELWWQFELSGEAPRFLRATIGAAVAVLLVALAKLIGPAAHEVDAPTDRDLENAAAAIACQGSTTPQLVFLRDKGLIFDDDRKGFVMYGVQGRTWVGMGDPVCAPDRVPLLIRSFLERCDDFGGTPVFYEVRRDNLHHYADFGLTFVKLGEEARVDLAQFTLSGGSASRYRQALRRIEKEHATVRIIAPGQSAAIMPALRKVSGKWLGKRRSEKGFSLGFFDETYLARYPIAVVERDGQVLAFANVWSTARREELSVDLMRYDEEIAPKGVMESLFVHLMVWGKEQGYRWFSLGMAPMSGFEESPVAPLWTKFGAFLYQHGESVYNFQGLRLFKDKFDPVWEPHYLAYPGGLSLPRVLADVTALIAGGYGNMIIGGRSRAGGDR
ncbi:MAG: bifunctional lysylphosphatidylglycerol flippase/synthetase MprF [Vicinamibacterales bacterium]